MRGTRPVIRSPVIPAESLPRARSRAGVRSSNGSCVAFFNRPRVACRPTLSAGSSAGFTLCEIVVALAIFAVGALGSAGILALAADTMARAEARAAAALATAQIGDSLGSGPLAGDGVRTFPRGIAAWTVSRDGAVTRVLLSVRTVGPDRADSVSSLIIRPDSVPTLRAWPGDSVSSSWW